jgi:copper chaperone CopZ
MKNVLLPTLLVLFTSCSPATSNNEQNQPQSKLCQRVKANTIQEIAVKGMVCQMGCGGSIRKALKETCAVERVEVNYIDSLEEQVIKVHYDREQIAPKQMLQVLSELNDRQFTVRTIGSPQALK